jgi:hypothetical protein
MSTVLKLDGDNRGREKGRLIIALVSILEDVKLLRFGGFRVQAARMSF